jgi:acetylornithine deacetylase/succinyl-diaminopimelate desuccinylase-like protein
MKGGVAMMLAAFLRAKAEGLTPPGDVLFLVVSDEESGGDYGAKFLVEEHARLFDGVATPSASSGGSPYTSAGAGSTPSRWPRSNCAF